MENKQIVNELIKIANMFSCSGAVPNYELDIRNKYLEQTGKELYQEEPNQEVFHNILSKKWEEICSKFSEEAKYIEINQKSEISKELFPKNNVRSVLERKIRNFICLIIIRNNMQIIASRVRHSLFIIELNKSNSAKSVKLNTKRFSDSIPSQTQISLLTQNIVKVSSKLPHFSPFDVNEPWQDERFIMQYHSFPAFNIVEKSKNNKTIGIIEFIESPIEKALKQIDLFQIKTCFKCYKIFFAEPRNLKFCSTRCRDRKKSRDYYEKHKATISERKKRGYQKNKQ